MTTTVQHANVERARRAYEAYDRGDMAAISDQLANDTVWHMGGSGQLAGEYRGKDAVFGLLAKIMELSGGTFKLKVHDVLANDDHVVTLASQTAERDGKRFESNVIHVSHPDSEGRTKEFWVFQENQAEADAFFS